MGIYWVYFISKAGHEMKLQIDAEGSEAAIWRAKEEARNMWAGWKYSHVSVCR